VIIVTLVLSFRDIAGFLLKQPTYPKIADVGALRREDPKLIIHVIIFELIPSLSPWYINTIDK